jgi:hypothetical protein
MCFSTSIYSTKEENHDSRAQSEAGRAVVSGVWSLDTDTVSPFLLDQKRARNFKSWQPGLGRTHDYMKNSPSAWGRGSSLISTLVPVPNLVPVPDPRRSSASPCSCITTDSLVVVEMDLSSHLSSIARRRTNIYSLFSSFYYPHLTLTFHAGCSVAGRWEAKRQQTPHSDSGCVHFPCKPKIFPLSPITSNF